MRRERLQNHVSGSVFTLPVCVVLALLLWWFPASRVGEGMFGAMSFDAPHLLSLLLSAFITYVLIETNNVNQLLRVRSRMVSSTWLVSAATIGVVHVYSAGLAAAACVSAAYYLLFTTYQKRQCVVSSFHYALFLGLASIFVPYVLFFFPLFVWHQMVFLRSVTLRTFFASLLGLLFPLSLWIGYWVVCDAYDTPQMWYATLTSGGPTPLSLEAYRALPLQCVVPWAFVSLLALIGALHYLFTSYNDKIQVRMLLYIFVFQYFVIQLFVALQPHHLPLFLPLLLVTASPLIAHFFALTRSWFTNALFVLAVLAFGALGYFCLFSHGRIC